MSNFLNVLDPESGSRVLNAVTNRMQKGDYLSITNLSGTNMRLVIPLITFFSIKKNGIDYKTTIDEKFAPRLSDTNELFTIAQELNSLPIVINQNIKSNVLFRSALFLK